MTIEQRAEECTYANHSFCKEAYIEGATEQQQIDIEKTCEWLKGHARYFGYAESDGLDAVYNYDSDLLVRMFTKAMKGE